MLEAALEGLAGVFQPQALALMTVGVLIGSVVGFLPGIGGPSTLAIMLPFVMTMKDPLLVIALLVGMDAVGNTASAFTSILISVPGASGSQATIMDGYPMAKRGEAARALSASFVASLLGGFFGAVVLFASLPVLRPIVLAFGSPEFFILTLWGVTMVGVLSGNAPLKGILAGILGVLIATVGLDTKSAVERYAFGLSYLWEGVSLVLVALGIFGIPELIDLATRKTSIAQTTELGRGFLQGIKDVFRHWWLLIRTSALGAWVGFLPGLGSSVGDWFAYAHAVQTEKNRENFGKGDVRGVIASEGANNAKEGGDYIPMLAFGLPGGAGSALVLTAFVAVGIKPGPDMLTSQLNLTFAVIWTLVIANVIATGLCMAFTKQIAKMCFLPFYAIVPPILAFIFMGAFAANFHSYDLTMLIIFSLLGFYMRRNGWPRPPLLLGLVLGNKMEMYLWLSYTRYGLEWLLRPMVLVLILLIVGTVAHSILTGRRESKHQVAQG
ncbi:MAG: tripartite tricarboxylate transporter permease [Candidatus Binatia bacterium]